MKEVLLQLVLRYFSLGEIEFVEDEFSEAIN